MEIKLVLVFVFCACVCFANGCNRSSSGNNNCSGGSCNSGRSLTKYARSQEGNAEKKGQSSKTELQGDLCNFNRYDINLDGVIEKDEVLAIISTSAKTDAVFAVLDLMKDNKAVTRDEFYALVPMFIDECSDSHKE
ncbi:uncharacterized protein LOC123543901 [Mercenaria mercenaria]|uniref:uncharacterized protein LOC123543901 n=1 Tax=Mercenaria mercenaria TaxID=6596 RepID=UPI00234F0CF9|nr:uncharacterized protein LOC123543901 [Mercenaria mercenaria]